MVLEKSLTTLGETRKVKSLTKANSKKINLTGEVGKFSKQIKVKATVSSMVSSKRGSDMAMEF